MSDPLEFLRQMMMIRAFEDALAARKDHGFQLLSSGEEAVAVGLAAALDPNDQLLTGGRSIGPALARGVPAGALMAELLGRSDGVNSGRAGRGHLADPDHGFFGAHAVVAGNVGVAAGVAVSRQLSGEPGLVAILFGDGASAAGILYETLNIAALWQLPMLFVCNNNQLSVSTPRSASNAAERLGDLGKLFGMPSLSVDGLDVVAVAEAAQALAGSVRAGGGPAFLEVSSIRLRSHSTTARETRKRDELNELRRRCPIEREVMRLLDVGTVDGDRIETIRREAVDAASAALAEAEASSYPAAATVLDHVG